MAAASLALVLVVWAAPPPASGQEPDPTSSTTTAPPVVTDPTDPGDDGGDPEEPTTSAPPQDPAQDPVAEEDAASEEVPVSDDTIPEDPEDPDVVDGAAAERLIRRELTVARADVARASTDVRAAADLVDDLTDRLADLQRDMAKLDLAHKVAVDRLEEARNRFEERVANAVVRGNAAELDTVFSSETANEADIRKAFLRSVSEADVNAVDEFTAAKAVLDEALLTVVETVDRTRSELRTARADLRESIRVNTERRFQLAVFAAGSEIVIRGFVFPVGEPYTFGDSWGYPRMTGTEYEHGHQGVDIMAPMGTPLYAAERGIVTRLGVDVLGGTKLWLKGASGAYYYYAHLSSYADGLTEGTVVAAGDLLGLVGDTGNARGGAPHLHFELHPGGGPAVNPYPLLRVVADLS